MRLVCTLLWEVMARKTMKWLRVQFSLWPGRWKSGVVTGAMVNFLSNLGGYAATPNLLALMNSMYVSINSRTGSHRRKVGFWYCMLLVQRQALFRMDAYWYPVFEDCVSWYNRSIVSIIYKWNICSEQPVGVRFLGCQSAPGNLSKIVPSNLDCERSFLCSR